MNERDGNISFPPLFRDSLGLLYSKVSTTINESFQHKYICTYPKITKATFYTDGIQILSVANASKDGDLVTVTRSENSKSGFMVADVVRHLYEIKEGESIVCQIKSEKIRYLKGDKGSVLIPATYTPVGDKIFRVQVISVPLKLVQYHTTTVNNVREYEVDMHPGKDALVNEVILSIISTKSGDRWLSGSEVFTLTKDKPVIVELESEIILDIPYEFGDEFDLSIPLAE